MKYDLSILEFPESALIIFPVYTGVVFDQGNRLMFAQGDNVNVLYRHGNERIGYKPYSTGVVVRGVSTDEDEKEYTKYCDLKTGSIIDIEKYEGDAVYFYRGTDFVVGTDDNGCLFTRLATGAIYTGKRSRQYRADGDFVYAYVSGPKVRDPQYHACYDKYLNEVWRYQPEKRRHRYFYDFYLHNDALIINGMYDTVRVPGQSDEDRNFEIVALYKITGKEKWRCMLDRRPSYAVLIGDRIYCYRKGGELVVVDANNGSIILEQHVGFNYDSIKEEREDAVNVFYHKEQYFVLSEVKGMKVFDKDFQLIQQLAWPRPDTSHCMGQFTCSYQIIRGVDDNIYFDLKHASDLSALAILTPSENDSPKITIRKRPEFKHERVPNSEGYTYKISIDSDNLNEVVSAGEYELKEVAQYYCLGRFGAHEDTDPNLNDQLIYSVKKSKLSDDAEEDLRLMVERVNKFFEIFMMKSAKTGKNFKVELEFR